MPSKCAPVIVYILFVRAPGDLQLCDAGFRCRQPARYAVLRIKAPALATCCTAGIMLTWLTHSHALCRRSDAWVVSVASGPNKEGASCPWRCC